MAVTLHQMSCFRATLDLGSFTHAADRLGLSQPALSEQVRLLEQSLRVPLFTRVGRGVQPTEAGLAFYGHATAALAAVESGQRAVGAVSRLEEGRVRFGLFGAAHLYIAADLVTTVAAEHPGLNLVLIGQNSADVIAEIRAGRIEAGLVALPVADDDQLSVTPVAQDEVVLVSHDPAHVRQPVTPSLLADLPLVLSEATWGDRDFTRAQISRTAQAAGHSLNVRFEVENVETALEIAASGHAQTIAARGVLKSLPAATAQALHVASLEPKIHDEFAIVRRRDVPLSPAAKFVMRQASKLLVTSTE